MGKLLTLSVEDLLVLLLALLIVFRPAAFRLLAALMTFRTSGRLRSAARILDRLIRETEQRRARRLKDLRKRRGIRSWKGRGNDSAPAVLGDVDEGSGSLRTREGQRAGA